MLQNNSFVSPVDCRFNPGMTTETNPPPSRTLQPWAVVAAGALSMMAAMGIGRFAFTPMLPLMIESGRLSMAAGGWLAAANYTGYLVGAWLASRVPLRSASLATLALGMTAAVTAGMAWPGPAAWGMALRFLAGLGSAWAFVSTSVWCLAALERVGRGTWSRAVYAGVGGGIALAGVHCLLATALDTSVAGLWLQLGGLALLLSLPMAWMSRRTAADAPGPVSQAARLPVPGPTRGLVVCYGVVGFGYILPATFLPVLAREAVRDPLLFGLAWPLFGLTAATSTLLAGWAARVPRVKVWASAQWLMGCGVLLPSLWSGGAAIALSALLVGGTFMVITMTGLQEIRARARGGDATRAVGRATVAFGLGQIAGPLLSSSLMQWPAFRQHGLDTVMQVGAAGLLLGATWLWRCAAVPEDPVPIPHPT